MNNIIGASGQENGMKKKRISGGSVDSPDGEGAPMPRWGEKEGESLQYPLDPPLTLVTSVSEKQYLFTKKTAKNPSGVVSNSK